MRDYKPSAPFNVPLLLLIPTVSEVKGVTVKTYPKATEGALFFGSFRSFGGTETMENGLLSIVDTVTVETWYRPDITANCRICLADNPVKVYEIIGQPENINMRNQYVKFKVQSVAGGA